MRVEECTKCGKPFEVIEIGGNASGGREREDIDCPHCGFTTTERTSGVFRTRKLRPDLEAAYIPLSQRKA